MINLLPHSRRVAISYARRNSHLLNVVLALIVIILLMLGAWGAGYMYINNNIKSYNKEISQKRELLKTQELEDVEQRIKEFSGNIKLIEQVFSKQVLFSELFRQIGSNIPSGAVLSSIEINDIEGGIDLIANAKSYDSATQVQVNLEDPANKLFEKVDIVSVSCNSTGEYPCVVTLRALFTKDNPFLFINRSGEDS